FHVTGVQTCALPILLKKYSTTTTKLMGVLVCVGLFFLILGLVLHQYFIVSKLLGTPSWVMYCNSISVFLFCLLYMIVDVFKIMRSEERRVGKECRSR